MRDIYSQRLATPVNTANKPAPTQQSMRRHGLPEIVRSLKSFSACHINEQRNTPGTPVWQRNYYEHIVRSERALDAVRQYIYDNPLRWELDRYNPSATGRDPEAANLWKLLQKEAFGKFIRK